MANAGTQSTSGESGSVTRAYPRRSRSERSCRGSPAETSHHGEVERRPRQAGELPVDQADNRAVVDQDVLGDPVPVDKREPRRRTGHYLLAQEVSTALNDHGGRRTKRLVDHARRLLDKALLGRLELVAHAAAAVGVAWDAV